MMGGTTWALHVLATAIFLLVAASLFASAVAADCTGIPTPDFKIQAPNASVPPSAAGWSGTWQGTWKYAIGANTYDSCARMYVSIADKSNITIAYCYGKVYGMSAGCYPPIAGAIDGNTLSYTTKSGARASFTTDSPGKAKGIYSVPNRAETYGDFEKVK